MLTPSVKLWLKKGKVSVLGEGRARLLRAIMEYGSIAEAARSMGMSYRHAWGIIKHIRESVGDEVVVTTRGGSRGGCSKLTGYGKQIVEQYEKNAMEIERLLKYGPKPVLAVDGVIIIDGDKIVLVRRKKAPYKGALALPGGFVEYNETIEDAVKREMREELGVGTRIRQVLGVYSDPERDPRQHVITVVYELEPESTKFKAGDDAAKVEIVSIYDRAKLESLAFDHSKIVIQTIGTKKGLKKVLKI